MIMKANRILVKCLIKAPITIHAFNKSTMINYNIKV